MKELEEALNRMDRNLDGLLPLSFNYWKEKAGRLINDYKGDNLEAYKLRYDTMIKIARQRRII